MAIEIVKAKPQAPSKFLVIGEPFSGKTTLAAKAPRPLFVSTDGNAAKMGLDAVNVKTTADIREAIEYIMNSKEYKTLVVDTIEGIVDIFTKGVIAEANSIGMRAPNGDPITALTDVPYGRLTGTLNVKVQNFANTLASLPHNVIVLSYTKRRIDDITNSIVLDSEFKNIRLLTRFMDAQVLTSYDGDKYKVQITNKRETMAGVFEPGEIAEFLAEIGWELPKRKTKVGSTKK